MPSSLYAAMPRVRQYGGSPRRSATPPRTVKEAEVFLSRIHQKAERWTFAWRPNLRGRQRLPGGPDSSCMRDPSDVLAVRTGDGPVTLAQAVAVPLSVQPGMLSGRPRLAGRLSGRLRLRKPRPDARRHPAAGAHRPDERLCKARLLLATVSEIQGPSAWGRGGSRDSRHLRMDLRPTRVQKRRVTCGD